jgi:prepilin-type N-terminal cleavage/methylation domain-containing protein
MKTSRSARAGRAGFSLIEMMVVVAILAVLSAIAIPIYLRFLRRSQTSEATLNLTHLYDGLMTYWVAEHTTVTGAVQNHLFPTSVGYTPAASCCGQADWQCVADYPTWNTPTWKALNFSLENYHRYRYAGSVIAGTGQNPGDVMELSALGDLNCDGVFGLFVRRARVDMNRALVSDGTTAFGELQ